MTQPDTAVAATRPPAVPRRYHAFGLRIASDFDLAEVDGGDGGDLDARIIRRGAADLPGRDEGAVFDFTGDAARMAWPEIAEFRITGGDRVEAAAAEGVDDALLSLPLLGPVMAVLLHQRGSLVLHGSTVGVGEAGVVFLGDKTAGKSTTAAAMVAAGHRLVTDDVVAVSLGPQGARITAAYPQLKLNQDAAARLAFRDAVDLPQPHPDFEKTRQRLGGEFSHAPIAPRALYVLERGEAGADILIEPLAPTDAFTALMRFSYASRFGEALLHGRAAGEHMARCARLASLAPVRRLVAPLGVDRLGELVSRVEEDVA